VAAGEVLVLTDVDVEGTGPAAAPVGSSGAPAARAVPPAPPDTPGPSSASPVGATTSVYRAAVPSVPRAAIIVRAPGQPVARVAVNGGTLRIGRARDNDIVIDDARVSRHHAQLSVRLGTLVYTDLDSTNGSFLYGNRVREIALGPKDVIQLGASSLTIEQAG
jgi:hypothetical protein